MSRLPSCKPKGGPPARAPARRIRVEVSVIIHATEDAARIHDAFDGMLGIIPGDFSVQELSGHHENPIMVLNAEYTGGRAGRLVGRLVRAIQPGEMARIVDGLGERVSGAGLHLRLGKQEFVLGRIAVRDGGSIRVRIYTPVYIKSETAGTYTALLDGATG